MKDNIHRVMLCFAALDLEDAELRHLLGELRSMPWHEIIAQVSALRHLAKHDQVDQSKKKRTSTKKPIGHSYDLSVGERVERLLKDEAGLTTSQAVNLLTLRLYTLDLIELDNIPPLSRRSLSDWVERLAQRVSEKDILRCATIIRNEYAHRPATDWPLKEFLK